MSLRITAEEEARGQDYSETGEAALLFGSGNSMMLEKGLHQTPQVAETEAPKHHMV